MKIEELDKNFKLTEIDRTDVKLYDVREAPFTLYGHEEKESDTLFRRMPSDKAAAVNDGVKWLHTNTAGIRVRFMTDSPFVAIRATCPCPCLMPHMTAIGDNGFDLYEDDRFTGSFQPRINQSGNCYTLPNTYEKLIELKQQGLHTITVNFPLYTNVSSLLIGLQENALVSAAPAYRYEKPVVYYGSSITQGGCASRPGNSYQAIISRRLNCDYRNLGFSGNAKGEQTMADYLADLPMSVFVLDYDHNAPSVDHLKATHKSFFDTIRTKNPTLPIVIVSAPEARRGSAYFEPRKEICKATYTAALAAGDKRVWFVDGSDIFHLYDPEMVTVDGCHPNDFGFFCMAELIGKAVKEALDCSES